MRQRSMVVVAFAVLIGAASARAQFTQYLAPGGGGLQAPQAKEALLKAMEEARWKLGPLRLAPWFGLREISYVDDVYGTPGDKTSDFTATASLGLLGYLARGKSVILGFYGMPEYVWWRDLDQRRLWNYRYGASLFVFANRLTLRLGGVAARQQQYLSREFEQLVNVSDTAAEADADLRVTGRVSIHADWRSDSWRYRRQDLPAGSLIHLESLDRDETTVRAGLRYWFNDLSSLTLGWGHHEVEPGQASAHSATGDRGDGPIVSWTVATDRFRLDLSAARYKLEPIGSSAFVPSQATLGSGRLAWRLGRASELAVYTSRNLVYSLSTRPYFEDERRGVSFQTGLGWRSNVRLFYESTVSNYPASLGVARESVKDRPSAGGAVTVLLGRQASFDLAVTRFHYNRVVVDQGPSAAYRVQANLRFAGPGTQWW